MTVERAGNSTVHFSTLSFLSSFSFPSLLFIAHSVVPTVTCPSTERVQNGQRMQSQFPVGRTNPPEVIVKRWSWLGSCTWVAFLFLVDRAALAFSHLCMCCVISAGIFIAGSSRQMRFVDHKEARASPNKDCCS